MSEHTPKIRILPETSKFYLIRHASFILIVSLQLWGRMPTSKLCALRLKKTKYTENDIINMLEFLVDNIFVVFGGKVFKQIVGIPMGTNLGDIFLYSYEADFVQSLLSTG